MFPRLLTRPIARLAVSIALLTAAALMIALATGLVAAPRAASLSSSPNASIARVLADASTWRGEQQDPAVTLPSGVQVKSSNYDGVRVGDTTYYYNLAPRASFDPLGRGEVTAKQVHVVAVVGDPPDRVLIYTLSDRQSAVSGQPSAISR